MYLLVCLALVGAAYGIPVSDTTSLATRNALYVLPTETYPTFYDVTLFLNPDDATGFDGEVTIRVLANTATDRIVMHAMEMAIDSLTVVREIDPNTNLVSSYTQASDDTHFLTITLTQQMQVDTPYIINVKYKGQYATNMFGVYLSTYQENGNPMRLITSQLQPTFARRAFPCYDEPALKAIFRTTIYAPAQYDVVRSNTVIRQDSLKPEVAGWAKHEFTDTLKMSTYLIAYLVSNFKYISNENDSNPAYNIPFRVYSRPDTQTFAEFALDFGQKNMVELEKYTEFVYNFPKLDKAAVPDFAAGAMENWGLVIYREAALLVQDGVTTTSVKQNIGRIICHENVHQWFGNEVGPQSWTFTWLNEGFANFFENFATDLVLPEWRMMDQFVIALQNVLQSDAVLSVNPMTHPVFTPSEILGTFNAVAYQKSGSVIRMMQHFLTPEVFRKGLVKYILKHHRGAATPDNLYAALREALDESDHSIPYQLELVMNRWANQGGFPMLDVTRTAPNAESIQISQRRYLTDTSLSSNDMWHVPVNWVLSTDPNFSSTSPQGWVPPANPAESFNIPGLSDAQWYIVNKQQTGYYRVNYEIANWQALARQLSDDHTIIHLLNRAQILDDAFNMARTANLDYRYAFDISQYLVKEKDYIPWAAVNPAFSYLDLALSGSNEYETYKNYLLTLTKPLYEELGFAVAAGEEHVTPYHRNIILDINCRYGNPDCIATATQLLQSYRNDQTVRLNPDIQNTVFCSGLRGGDVENFNFLWSQLQASTDSTEQSILLNSMGCTSNVERRTFYLNQVIDDNSPVRQQDKSTIIISVINGSPENMDAALDFCIEHWPEIQPRVQGLTGTTNILNTFARGLTTQAHADKIKEFSSRHQNVFTAGEQASLGFIEENISASIAWTTKNGGAVETWLRENYGSGAAPLAAGLLVFLSIIVALFNH